MTQLNMELKSKEEALSKAARKLLFRLRQERYWYKWTDKPGPAMRELIAAGLVGEIGRVRQIERCFVPAGTQPLQCEQFP